MSKYRRKTANARERQRMRQVNVAFDKLKAAIPHHKLDLIETDTKITTLRCAISYINALSDLLTHVKQGREIEPEFYCTDAQLGLLDEGSKKRPKVKTVPDLKRSSLPPPEVLALARSPLPIIVEPLTFESTVKAKNIIIQSEVSLFSTAFEDELIQLDFDLAL